MVALTAQFKRKCSLERREFVRVAYANFLFEAGISAKYKTPHAGEKLVVRKSQSSEMLLLLAETNQVKTLFLLAISGINFNQFKNRIEQAISAKMTVGKFNLKLIP